MLEAPPTEEVSLTDLSTRLKAPTGTVNAVRTRHMAARIQAALQKRPDLLKRIMGKYEKEVGYIGV
jgi:hypothetical protein